MKRILTLLLLIIGIQAQAQYTSTLPAGYTPFATQMYFKIVSGDTTFVEGASGKGFHVLVANQALRDSLATYVKKDFSNVASGTILKAKVDTSATGLQTVSNLFPKGDTRYLRGVSLFATSPIFYNSTTRVISSQAASGTLEGYVTTGAQTIAGLKTFSGNMLIGSATPIANNGVGSMSPLEVSGTSDGIGIAVATSNTAYNAENYFAGFLRGGGSTSIKAGVYTVIKGFDPNGNNTSFGLDIHATKVTAGVSADKFGFVYYADKGFNIFPASRDTLLDPGRNVLKVSGAVVINHKGTGTAGTDSLIVSGPDSRLKVISPAYYATSLSPTFTGTVTLPNTVVSGSFSAGTIATNSIQANVNNSFDIGTNGGNIFRKLYVTDANINSLTASSSVATDASKNLISVANTGTGNNVLATSPTLVTPVIGAATGTTLVLSGAITSSNLASGPYTPTGTAVANVTSSVMRNCTYTRVGSVVHVQGTVTITPTTGGVDTQFGVSLPPGLASNFTNSTQLNGTAISNSSGSHYVCYADTVNDRMEIYGVPSVGATAVTLYLSFSYQVL